jgi:hypothetical protein
VGVAVQTGAMQCGVEGGVGDVGQRPGGAVAGEGAFHGPAVAEEKDVSGLEEDRVHASGGFIGSVVGGFSGSAMGKGDGLAEADEGAEFVLGGI